MDLNQYTTKAQQALVEAERLTEAYHHSELEPAHVLLSLMNQTDGVVPQVVSKIGAHPPLIITDVEHLLANRPQVRGSSAQKSASRAVLTVLNDSETEARNMHDEYVSTEHILLALTNDRTTGDILARHSVDHNAVLRALADIRGGQRVTTQDPENTYQSLQKIRARYDRPGPPGQT